MKFLFHHVYLFCLDCAGIAVFGLLLGLILQLPEKLTAAMILLCWLVLALLLPRSLYDSDSNPNS